MGLDDSRLVDDGGHAQMTVVAETRDLGERPSRDQAVRWIEVGQSPVEFKIANQARARFQLSEG